MDVKSHWAQVYRTKSPTDVSWYQEHPRLSLELIQRARGDAGTAIIDVGAGASTLADHLLTKGYGDVTLLDISGTALEVTRKRVERNPDVSRRLKLLEGDVTTMLLEHRRYDVWHDRAVFHFLTDSDQQQLYIRQVLHTVKPGGHVIIATFTLDGPEQCSGLPAARYDADTLQRTFGAQFHLIDTINETHRTPWGSEQRFVYCCFRVQG